jgi:hypothetical protein
VKIFRKIFKMFKKKEVKPKTIAITLEEYERILKECYREAFPEMFIDKSEGNEK